MADAVAAIGFIAFGPVHWAAALSLAAGLFVGSRVGPSLTRRVPSNLLRIFATGAGLALAAWLFAHE
jgi:uncharacterized membrane protein YfcA